MQKKLTKHKMLGGQPLLFCREGRRRNDQQSNHDPFDDSNSMTVNSISEPCAVKAEGFLSSWALPNTRRSQLCAHGRPIANPALRRGASAWGEHLAWCEATGGTGAPHALFPGRVPCHRGQVRETGHETGHLFEHLQAAARPSHMQSDIAPPPRSLVHPYIWG